MLEIKDPAFKLFGKTIPVAGDGEESPRESNDSSNSSEQHEAKKDFAEEESMEVEQPDDDLSPQAKEESGDPPSMPEADENHKEPGSGKDSESPKEEKDSNEKNSQQKPIKKPDKILPCPRCNSMDTKFCYYNNYNINQPRHFCKNCQRYWTAGGTMRNVPVGAGRRKNKSSSSRYCHITISEALQAAQLDVTNGVHHPGLKPNGTVLTFGSDSPLCESMASVLNLAEKKVLYDDHSNASMVTTSTRDNGLKKGPQDPIKPNLNGFANQVPCFQWPYMWNPSAVPVPPFYPPPGFPMLFTEPYWNGAIPWNVPWVSSPCSPGQKIPGSNPNSPTLGKHSRDGEMLKPGDNEKSSSTILVPKTLRIDDPDEAAKSSIWTTLGIQKEKGDKIGGKKVFFNSLQTKGEEKDHKMETHQALKANPAALSRSINFQEIASR